MGTNKKHNFMFNGLNEFIKLFWKKGVFISDRQGPFVI